MILFYILVTGIKDSQRMKVCSWNCGRSHFVHDGIRNFVASLKIPLDNLRCLCHEPPSNET